MLPRPNLATSWPGGSAPTAAKGRGQSFADRDPARDTEPFNQDSSAENAIRPKLKLKGVR
jgi:hypothetical protein